MSVLYINVSDEITERVNIGRQGENIVERIVFDISDWVDEYGEGEALIYAKRKGDSEAYPVALEMDMEAKTATWRLTLTDTAVNGKGSAQLVYVVEGDDDTEITDDEIKKSQIYVTTVTKSIVALSDDPPSGYESWLEILGGYTVRVEAGVTAANAAKTAAQAAQAAAESAQAAAEAARDAAQTSKAAAETSAINAATSSAAAANSAASAQGSAASAGEYAGDASGYATQASGHAADAQTAANSARNNATAAGTSATQAAASAEAAAGSAEEAAETAARMVTNLVDGTGDGSVKGVNATAASGTDSFAEGTMTTASGNQSHAEGGGTTASGATSHAEGGGTEATAQNAHAEGGGTHALGTASHAEGLTTTARGSASHAEGIYTEAIADAQHVEGKYNIIDTNGVYAHIIGNGVSGSRSNAFTVDWSGNTHAAGEITDGTGNTLSDKLDSVSGKGLSTEDYTTAEKSKLSGIEDGAEVNPTIDTELSTESTNPVQNKAIAEAIEEVSEGLSTGYYPDLYAGGLVTDKGETDVSPYTFRASKALGYRESLNQIVGATVGWNQLVPVPASDISETRSGITFTDNRDGTFTVTGTATATLYKELASISTVPGHKYLISGCPQGGSPSKYQTDIDGEANAVEYGNGKVFVSTKAVSLYYIVIRNGATLSSAVFTPNLIDLTQAFGSTIADYIYSLEQATAGSGIAKLREWGFFRDSYYAYDPGSLQSVCVGAHETTGFNAWDEVAESGYIVVNTGEDAPEETRYRSKNYIPVMPNTSYFLKVSTYSYQHNATTRMYFYDAEKNYIESPSGSAANRIFTAPANAHYMRFFVNTALANYDHDICINISKTTGSPKNGDYVPHEKHSYPLDSSLTLCGILKLSGDEITADGDVYEADGTVTRKYGVVDLGTLTWAKYDTQFYANIPNAKVPSYGVVANAICSNYPMVAMNALVDKTIAINNGQSRVNVIDLSYTDATAFKTAMSGVYLVYELATPTTETADPYTQIQICDPDGTEQFVDYGVESGDRDVAIPVGHSTFYPEDLKGKLEDIPDIPEAPASNGTYTLKAVRSNSGVTYSWVSG